MTYQHVDLEGNSIRVCPKCGREFDLLQFGYPGNPYRTICWDCEPMYHCKPNKSVAQCCWEELSAMEDRCLGDYVD